MGTYLRHWIKTKTNYDKKNNEKLPFLRNCQTMKVLLLELRLKVNAVMSDVFHRNNNEPKPESNRSKLSYAYKPQKFGSILVQLQTLVCLVAHQNKR
ncbi:MAG: hypothetical protein OXC92_08605 [Flavobacteriaceae bacterium]|nr:hypothetical protein [Flavobacteriaceae bacterium]